MNSLRVEILDGIGLLKTSTLGGLKEPYCRVTLGRYQLVCANAEGSTTNPHIGGLFLFPFSGEDRLRIEVFDKKHREAGFCDFNLRSINASNPNFTGRVQLGAAKGKAGELSVEINLCPECILAPIASKCLIKGKKPTIEELTSHQVVTSKAQSPKMTDKADEDDLMTRISTRTAFLGLRITVFSGKGLKNVENFGKMDPYIRLSIGRMVLTSKVLKDAGSDPHFDAVFTMPYANQKFLLIEVIDRETVKADRLSGYVKIDLEDFVRLSSSRYTASMTTRKGQQEGFLDMEITFLAEHIFETTVKYLNSSDSPSTITSSSRSPPTTNPKSPGVSGSLSSHGQSKVSIPHSYKAVAVVVRDTKDLEDPEKFGKMDPYVKCRLGESWLQSRCIGGGGPSTTINSRLIFPYAGQRTLLVQAVDRQRMSKDRIVGTAKVNLESLLSKRITGAQDLLIALITSKGVQKGVVSLNVEFCDAPIAEPLVEHLELPKRTKSPGAKSAKATAPLSSSSDSSSSQGFSRAIVLQRFRSFSLHIIGIKDVHDPERMGKLDPYIKARLGKSYLRSPTRRNAGSTCDINATLNFPYEGQKTVKIEVYDREHLVSDRICGIVRLDLEEIFNVSGDGKIVEKLLFCPPKNELKGIIILQPQFHLEPISRAAVVDKMSKVAAKASSRRKSIGYASSDSSDGQDMLKLNSIPYKGVIFHVIRAEGLYDPERFGKLDPYVAARMGNLWLQTEKMHNAGVNPILETFLRFPYGGQRNIHLQVLDSQRLGSDRIIGKARLDLEGFVQSPPLPNEVNAVTLLDPKGCPGGKLYYKIGFSKHTIPPSVERALRPPPNASRSPPAITASPDKSPRPASVSSHGCSKVALSHHYRTLSITIKSGKNLYDPEALGKMDPYVKVRLGNVILRCPALDNAGNNPDFDTTYIFPYTNARRAKFIVYDRRRFAKDRVVGVAKLDLEPLVSRKQSGALQVALVDPKGKSDGHLVLVAEFITTPTSSAAVYRKLRDSAEKIIRKQSNSSDDA